LGATIIYSSRCHCSKAYTIAT